MEHSAKVPKNKRANLAMPLGELIAGTREETIPKVEKKFKGEQYSQKKINFYIVGDIVTEDFLKNPFLKQFVKVCIIDEKTQRKRVEIDGKDFFEEIIEFKNPTGTINKDSWELIKKVIKSQKKTLIIITEGEEDLLVFPMVLGLNLSDNIRSDEVNFVCYGQPPVTDAEPPIPQGVVVAKITKKVQEIVKKLVSAMKMI